MALRRGRDAESASDVPVQSFSDIAFLLIIFFVLATTLAQLSGIVTDMPAGETTEAKAEKTNIVQVHDGQISMNEDKVSVDALRSKLKGMNLKVKRGDDKVVLLEATGAVPYQLYYDIVTAISGAGGVIAIVQVDEGDDK